MADEKKYFRAILKECRDAMSDAFAASASALIQARVLSSAEYRAVSRVVLYAEKDREAATGLILDDALKSGRTVFLPRFDTLKNQYAVASVRNRGELVRGTFGILEPPPGSEGLGAAEIGAALICVPGVAFTSNGRRIGRGLGHYDRFLAGVGREAITMGLAYSFQLLDRLAQSRFDRRLNVIVTESALYRACEAPLPAASSADRGGTPGWIS